MQLQTRAASVRQVRLSRFGTLSMGSQQRVTHRTTARAARINAPSLAWRQRPVRLAQAPIHRGPDRF